MIHNGLSGDAVLLLPAAGLDGNRLAYRGRNVAEPTTGHPKENRRIGTRFEKLATGFLGMLKMTP